MKAIITVGMQFGDEGKGATVDYLCKIEDVRAVVRYCGGSQAAHTVVLEDGRKHTFSQFGSGTLRGVPTILGRNVIVNLPALSKEAKHLKSIGIDNPYDMIRIDDRCLISTPYHQALNRIKEICRTKKHGSCGHGIGETRKYWLDYGKDSLIFKDLLDKSISLDKLDLIRNRLLIQAQDYDLNRCIDFLNVFKWNVRDIYEEICCVYEKMSQSKFNINHSKDLVVFEGSQGVLLDEWVGFHPYTTWSTVTLRHALEICEDLNVPNVDINVLGIVRSMTTRHGAGPLPSYSEKLQHKYIDENNPTNHWQGAMRFGYFDFVLFKYACEQLKKEFRLDGIVVNHLDQFPNQVCFDYENVLSFNPDTHNLKAQEEASNLLLNAEMNQYGMSTEEFLKEITKQSGCPVEIVSYGPTASDRKRLIDGK